MSAATVPFDVSLSIVVLSHNRKNDLEINLHQLLDMVRDYGFELIVVDNASTDGSVELITEIVSSHERTKIVLNHTNLGVAGGRNAGWRVATGQFILNIDDDTVITVDAAHAMLATLQNHQNVGIASPRILHAKTKARQFDFGGTECPVGNFHGACHMLRTSLVERIGLNDEACSFGGEELDYSIRARAAGCDVIYTPNATVLHNSLLRQGAEGRERRIRWVHNFIRVHHKHFPLSTAVVFSLRYLLSHLASGVRMHGLVFGLRLIESAWNGFREGRRHHRTVPYHVVRFYLDPGLRPEFGNVPLWRKMFGSRR